MKTYFPIINLLRALAVIMICLYHFAHFHDGEFMLFEVDHWFLKITSAGETWVYTFFVISGFVIPLSMSKGKYVMSHFFRYLGRRIIRIEIPYIVSMLLILMVGLAFALKNNQSYSVDIEQVIWHVFFLVPFSEYEWYNPIYWTLAIEIQFYILIGLIFPLIRKNNIVSYLILAALGLSGIIFPDQRFLFHYGSIFAVGIVLYLTMFLEIKRAVGLGLIVLFIATTWYNHNTDIAMVAVLSLYAISSIELDKAWINKLGDISYSLYLTHGTVGISIIYLWGRNSDSEIYIIGMSLIALVASILFSRIYWKYIELPSTKLSRKIKI